MRSSAAVGLLLVSSMSIFGIYGRQKSNPALPPGPEPVWVNGQQGVYHPVTGEFIPSNSPAFDETCDLIQQQRAAAMNQNYGSATTRGSSNTNTYLHSYGTHYGSTYGGASAARSLSDSHFSSASGSSIRGGIGATGHAMSGAAS